MLNAHYLPLADLADTLRVVMPIIFVVIYGVAHLVGALQQEKKKREQRPPQRDPLELELDRPQRAGGVPERAEPVRGKPATLEETLRREVEEFLKRAQGQPSTPPQAKRPPSPPRQRSSAPSQKSRPQQSAEPPTRRLVDDPQSVTNRKAEPVLEVVRTGAPTGAAVDAYVAEQMRGVAAIGQHAQRLGEEVAQADDRMQAQLQQKFDHRVGTLAPSSASTISPQDVSPGSSAARAFRELLARPGGMRQMVIANEILRRPEERW
ncbi:MAG: hypothetical protein JNL18_19395 [Planctomycetaceae bacterium]|jgi:hypothetical protein|nr:hypothetical protein [Planctomycetaceae bacterium]